MSGRKSSEVAGVLKQGEAVRQMTDGIYSSQIEKDFDNCRRILSKIKELQTQSEKMSSELNQEARNMFANEAEVQLNDFKAIQKSLMQLEASEETGENIRRQLKNLDKQLADADNEAEDIRRSIRGKDWYCDEEYSRAQKLVRTYKRLRDQRVNLQHQMTQITQSASQRLNQAQSMYNRLNKLKSQIEDMNEVARKRQESDVMRNELKQALQNIPVNWAEKFFDTEYKGLQETVDRAIAENDDTLIRTFKNVYGTVTTFKTKLDARIEEWQQQKSDAESWIKKVEDLAKIELIGPIDYYNDGENGQKVGLFDYIQQYGNKDYQTDYRKNLDEARTKIQHESFIEATELLKKTAEIVTNARDYAAELQESMLKKTELAGAIQNVMADLKYNVDLSILNDNPNDGYKITCSIGDEIIEFDRVDIDNEGNVIVDINHKEAIGGTCQNSWKDITHRMREAGIPITNVKKGDKSVIAAPKKQPGISTPSRGTTSTH